MTRRNVDLFKSLLSVENKKSDYKWKDDKSRMLRMLRNSKTLKEKNGWSRDGGTGFIADDIQCIWLFDEKNKTLGIRLPIGTLFWKPADFNLRETEEAIKFLERT